jgi:hypothetical protein
VCHLLKPLHTIVDNSIAFFILLLITVIEDLPDDYFTPTIADLKARQQQLHARAAALNHAPLLTRAQREQQAKTKRDRWPNVRFCPCLCSCKARALIVRVANS